MIQPYLSAPDLPDTSCICDGESLQHFLRHFKEYIGTQEQTHSRDQIQESLTAVRVFTAGSPFIRRAQTWPRGYAGDFETIHYLLQGNNGAAPGTPGFFIEDFFLQSDICAQHRNKIAQQSCIITDTLERNPDAAIISIGCGTSEDLAQNIPQLSAGRAMVTLIDADPDAIAFSCRRLHALADRVTTMRGNIYRIVRSLPQRYDLILIGGVFDYLSDKVICAVLQTLRQHTAPGGKLFFTNIDAGNGYRVFMEYLADWVLIGRSDTQLRELVIRAGWPDRSIAIHKDATGLAHMVTLSAD